MPPMEEAMEMARARFGLQLADSVRIERADFGWIARVEERNAADGLIGHLVLAIGPGVAQCHFHPAGSSAHVRRAHLAWLDNTSRRSDDHVGPASFT